MDIQRPSFEGKARALGWTLVIAWTANFVFSPHLATAGPEEIKAVKRRLESNVWDEREAALNQIIGGQGGPELIATLGRMLAKEAEERLDPDSGNELLTSLLKGNERMSDILLSGYGEDIAEFDQRIQLIFSALESLAPQAPESAAQTLFSLLSIPDREVQSQAARMFLKSGPPAQTIVRSLLAADKFPEAQGHRLMALAANMPPEQAVEVIRKGLSSKEPPTIALVADALHEQLARGANPEIFHGLLGEFCALLTNDRFLNSPYSTADFIASLAADQLFPPNTPDLVKAIRYAYQKKKVKGLSGRQEAKWLDILSASLGRAVAVRDPAEKETIRARDSLERALSNLTSANAAEENSAEMSRDVQRFYANEVAHDLGALEPAEARDYLRRFMRIPGNQSFRLRLALSLQESQESRFSDLAKSVTSCQRLLAAYERWKQRRNRP